MAHDSDHCLNCRLAALINELFPGETLTTEDATAILKTLAYSAGSILSTCDADMMNEFLQATVYYHNMVSIQLATETRQ